MRHRFLRSAILQAIAVPPLFLAAQSAWGQRAPIEIVANLTDAPRRLYHAEIDLPVKAGPLDLITPEWIPGEHMPNGPAQNITGVVFTANGKTLPWRRDSVDLRVSCDGSGGRYDSARAPGLHCECAGFGEAGGAGMGEAAALSGAGAGAGHFDSALCESSGRVGDRYGAKAGERRVVS